MKRSSCGLSLSLIITFVFVRVAHSQYTVTQLTNNGYDDGSPQIGNNGYVVCRGGGTANLFTGRIPFES